MATGQASCQTTHPGRGGSGGPFPWCQGVSATCRRHVGEWWSRHIQYDSRTRRTQTETPQGGLTLEDPRLLPPPAEVNAAQQRFEAALAPLAPSSHSELVHVSTGMGLKEWVFYARSREEFMGELNELLSGHPEYPIEIHFYEDPAWEVWEDLVKDLRGRAESLSR